MLWFFTLNACASLKSKRGSLMNWISTLKIIHPSSIEFNLFSKNLSYLHVWPIFMSNSLIIMRPLMSIIKFTMNTLRIIILNSSDISIVMADLWLKSMKGCKNWLLILMNSPNGLSCYPRFWNPYKWKTSPNQAALILAW